VKPDTLDEENRRFSQRALLQPVFLNSVPKSGSHLLRNIVRMFVPVEQQYHEQFIQWAILQDHLRAFDTRKNMLSWGHLWFSDDSAIETARVRKILLYRDPYDWVVARARFFLSDEFHGNIERIKSGALSIDTLFSLMIFGIPKKAPPLSDYFMFNAAAWLGSVDHVVRFEELRDHLRALESEESEDYFRRLFAACGIDPVPDDWRERVRIGSAPLQSATARENLSGLAVDIPDELPDLHKRLVDVAVPGMRKLLGYA
jgi:hypothetical protein